jgi:hypothetical protein
LYLHLQALLLLLQLLLLLRQNRLSVSIRTFLY